MGDVSPGEWLAARLGGTAARWEHEIRHTRARLIQRMRDEHRNYPPGIRPPTDWDLARDIAKVMPVVDTAVEMAAEQAAKRDAVRAAVYADGVAPMPAMPWRRGVRA